MKVNILFSIQEQAARRAQAGPDDKSLHVRATGRTLGIAMSALGIAMQEDNHRVSFSIPNDHYNPQCHRSRDNVADMMVSLISKLGLQGFTIDRKRMTYCYQVIYEV